MTAFDKDKRKKTENPAHPGGELSHLKRRKLHYIDQGSVLFAVQQIVRNLLSLSFMLKTIP